MDKTKIDWCDSTWNPVTGCRHKCRYCYARKIANRFSHEGETVRYSGGTSEIKQSGTGTHVLRYPVSTVDGQRVPYPFGFEPTLHHYKLDEYKNKSGRNIFVCSMADLFGDWVPDNWLDEVFDACEKSPQHNYLFLTKNVQRYCKNIGGYGVPLADNMWYGTTITKRDEVTRFDLLPAFSHTFVSIEPLLEDLEPEKCNIMFMQVDWFIIGAETGNRKNKIIPKREWIEAIVNECRKYKKPVFMKSSLAPIWGEPLIQEFPESLNTSSAENVKENNNV